MEEITFIISIGTLFSAVSCIRKVSGIQPTMLHGVDPVGDPVNETFATSGWFDLLQSGGMFSP